jgi:hypothetical protein
MISSAPKFKKVELLLIKNKNNKNNDITSLYKISYDDCAMVITGDYIIITQESGDNNIDEPMSITGKIHKLDEVDSYRLYNN